MRRQNQTQLSRRETDCGSMPGGEELCREEASSSSSSNSMDYNLSDGQPNTNMGTSVDYEMYSLGGSDGGNSEFFIT